MLLKSKLIFCAVLFFLLSSAIASDLDKDIQDASDPAGLPRLKGSVIVGYEQSNYDLGRFFNGNSDRKQQYTEAEGRRTRVAYLGQQGVSTIQVLRSYQAAFNGLGKVDEKFICKPPSKCLLRPTKTDQITINSLPSYLTSVYYLRSDIDGVYWYGTIETSESLFHVSFYSGIQDNGEPNLKRFHGRPLIFLHIIETSDFSATLEFVTAEHITEKINKTGSVALYGIQFEFNSSTLTNESNTTLSEITKSLSNDPSLSLFVVGHTDNVGDYSYNQQLSAKRAASVRNALINKHGVNSQRLTAVGVGPVAPVASNSTDEGKAKNRRVELVRK
jgi:flagellar motor protein MotB